MKILIVGDFRYDSPHIMVNEAHRFQKGFARSNHDVLPFSYRTLLLQQSMFRSKKLSLRFFKKKTDQLLIKMAKQYQPDLVLITAYKFLDEETVLSLKEALPKSVFSFWYGDFNEGVDPMVANIAKHCDWFLSSSGGEVLKNYKALGIQNCAFIPNPCDNDLDKTYSVEEKWLSKLLFLGTLKHGRKNGQDPLREELIHYLIKNKNLTLWRGLDRPSLHGQDYLNAICGADIAISINSLNHIRFYHSFRLFHYLGCGTFTLAKHVPDSELLYEDGKHLHYFNTKEECLELIKRFENDEKGRNKIALAGQKHTHESFNCKKMASYITDLATTGTHKKEPWSEII